MRFDDDTSRSRHVVPQHSTHHGSLDEPPATATASQAESHDARLSVSRVLFEKCEEMKVAVCLAAASRSGLPIVFTNSYFGEMTGWPCDEIVGKSSLFLKGTLTEQTLEDEISLAIQQNEEISLALINYRRSDALFFNLMSVRPLPISRGEPLLMICQTDFTPARGMRPYLPLISALDAAWRAVRNGSTRPSKSLTQNDLYQLETISIRFEAAFLRAQNALIRKSSPERIQRLAELAEMQRQQLRSSAHNRLRRQAIRTGL